MRIGELSRELETAKNQYDARDNDVASKTETLAKAGVNIRTAERYEELAGGKEKQAQQIRLLRQEIVSHPQYPRLPTI
jgi:hypothetical protein